MSRTSDGTKPAAPAASAGAERSRNRLQRLIVAARLSLLWDRVWPGLIAPLCVASVFLIASGLGLWVGLPVPARIAGIVLFAGALVATLVPLSRIRVPTRDEALARIDRGGTLKAHRPATSAEDTLALGTTDPAARALWAAHQARAAKAVMDLPVPTPHPNAPGSDPFAFRAAALVAVVASMVVAGVEWRPRIAAAFDWRGAVAEGPAFRLDGWIDPPVYTRQPPTVLDLAQAPDGAAKSLSVRVPVNSVVILRAAGRDDVGVVMTGGLKDAPKPQAEGEAEAAPAAGAPPATSLPATARAPAGGAAFERRLIVAGGGTLQVSVGGRARASLSVEAVPDLAPQVEWSRPPEQTGQGGLTITYKARDDYAVAQLEGVMEPVDPAAAGRALVPPPRPPLALPADPTADQETASSLDLADHPWAGARVTMTLIAKDDAGQEGRSEPLVITLPQRTFVNPLAKALVEQRRNLIMDRDQRRMVQTALDALMIAPDTFTPKLGEYLGLSIGAQRLRAARTDDELRDVAQYLWEMAVRLEDGDLSAAERELRAAEQALREAIERGASEDEIRRLMQQFRQAMNNMLRELAERAQRNQQNAENQQNEPNQRNQVQRTITPQDLNRMLDRIEEMMRNGQTAEAQRMLEQLRQMMENMQTARPGRNQRQQEMEQSLNELDEMTRDQQDLRDETFQNQPPGQRDQMRRQQQQRQNQFGQGQQNRQRQQQGQRQRGQQGQQGEQGEGENGEQQAEGQQPGQGPGQGLAQRQQQLRERLEALRRRMQERGQQGGSQELGEAEDAMRQAERGLGQGDGQGALEGQGRALDALRRGGEQMARDMQPGEGGEGEGQANGPDNSDGSDQPGSRQAERGQDQNDPLGRPTRNPRANDNARFDRQGGRSGSEIRIDEVIQELRRRLGDPNRAREELDYFERLLRMR